MVDVPHLRRAQSLILDGGLPAWKAEGRPTEAGEVKRDKRTFNASMDTGAVAMVSDVQMALNDPNTQVVDARSAGRFAGREKEPRAGLRSGHMPGAFNVPFTEIVENGRLVSPERIAQAFKKAGVDLEKPVITSCGSGVTAAILTFGLDALGKNRPASMTAHGPNGAPAPTCRSPRTRQGLIEDQSRSKSFCCRG